jgi:two-component system catabolic regulation response regulator CreB
MARILVVEDEQGIADAVLYALRAEGLQAEHCLRGEPALERLRRERFDAAILDVGLPDLDGFSLCRRLRAFSDIPVLFLTARDGEIDRVLGLELGADDYVVKPFSPRELVARVRAVLRRSRGAQPSTGFEHDADGHRVFFRGRLLDLTRYEYGLLAALLQRPGAILTRAQLMERVWGHDSETSDRTVDTHVKTLRAKLREVDAEADVIQTQRGVGYSIRGE